MVKLTLNCCEMCKEILYRLGQLLAQGFQVSKNFTFLLHFQQQSILKYFPECLKTIALVALFDSLVYSYSIISWGFS